MPDQNLMACVTSLEVVLIFTGDITPTDPTHLNGIGWRSISGIEADINGACPSLERVRAAHVLYQINPSLIFVASGGLTNNPQGGKGETSARVVAAELRALGVPANQIIEESDSFSSFEQVINCAKMAREYDWEAKNIGVLSLFWHLPRIASQMFIGSWQADVSPLDAGSNALLSVERILSFKDAAYWDVYFRNLYATPEMAQRLVAEMLGNGQLWSGYSPKYPKPYSGFADPLVDRD